MEHLVVHLERLVEVGQRLHLIVTLKCGINVEYLDNLFNQIIINTLANCDSAWWICVLPFFTRRMYLSLSTAAPQNGHGFGTWREIRGLIEYN